MNVDCLRIILLTYITVSPIFTEGCCFLLSKMKVCEPAVWG